MSTLGPSSEHPRLWLLASFFVCYVLSATAFQWESDVPPWVDGSPIEFFTGALLIASSILSLLRADLLLGERRKALYWLAVSAGLAVLAFDEIFLLHEHTAKLVGNDDHMKFPQWIVAVVAVCLICRHEQTSTRMRMAFSAGLLLHLVYVLVDLGDGDYFQVPLLSLTQLRWLEEYLELFALIAYCLGFLFIYTASVRESGSGAADGAKGD